MNLTAISALQGAVDKGAAYLDARYSGWRWRINREALEATCGEHSVTGQLFGENLTDQLRGVGIDSDTDPKKAMESCIAFAAMGFTVMVAEPVTIPEEVRTGMKQVIDSLAALIGPDYLPPEVPEVIPVPRDPDTVRMEAEALQLIWEREVDKR